jgi:hypothetical protein
VVRGRRGHPSVPGIAMPMRRLLPFILSLPIIVLLATGCARHDEHI